MDKNDYLVGHMFHLMGHASDFVELEEVSDKHKALMGCPIEFSQPGQWNRRGYWEREKKKSLQVGTPKPVFMLEMASWIIIWVVLEPQV